MAASRKDISEWFDRGKKMGATHLVVVCDTFDYTDFPRYVMPGKDPYEACTGANMEKVMEVYALHLNKEEQLKEYRAFHYEQKEEPQQEQAQQEHPQQEHPQQEQHQQHQQPGNGNE